MPRPRLRDNQGRQPFELYPLGEIPKDVIINISKWIAYRYAVGQTDIDGEDWGDIFSLALGGEHLGSPIGLADVIYRNMAWSVKSIKNEHPHTTRTIRVISGRCSPDYSLGITDPHTDVSKTGHAVLSIYNERINLAKNRYEPLRTCILVRNNNTMEYLLFEKDTTRYNTQEYEWSINNRGNFKGVEKTSGKHVFTWQPHGAQFTIIYDIPVSSHKFILKRPSVLDFQTTMDQIGFDDSWVTIL